MVIKIRFPQGAKVKRIPGTSGYLAGAAAGLLTMTAVAFMLLAMWRLTSDLEWTDPFFISDGIFSHWQVWLALTVATGALTVRLKRYARLQEELAADLADEPGFVNTTPGDVEVDRERTATR